MENTDRLDIVLGELSTYIKNKARGNYYGDNQVQVIDLLRTTGDLDSFCRGNAIKYITRFKRKLNSDSEIDLFKAIHYILIMIMEIEEDPN